MDTDEITLLLDQVRHGNEAARDRVTKIIHDTLHAMALSKLRRERPGHVLQTTALVNEAVVRLLRQKVIERSPNGRFLMAAAGRAMCAFSWTTPGGVAPRPEPAWKTASCSMTLSTEMEDEDCRSSN